MHNSPVMDARLAALREEVRRVERSGSAGDERPCLAFDIPEVDQRLAGGGLAWGLHEAAPATPAPNDEAAATLFLAALAARFAIARGKGGQVLWALTRRDLFAPGLAQAGLAPDRLLYAECRNDEEVLAVMEEGARHGSLACMVGEVGRLAMASARRLQLAAEEGGGAALMLRRWRKANVDPLGASTGMSTPSPALTRWRIACAPSAALPYERIGPYDGIGRARWQVALARQRGGPPFQWILEAPDAEARLALAARSGDRPDQADAAHRRAA
jgi:protein ImuA